MSPFAAPVRDHMSAPLFTVGPEAHLPEVSRLLSDAGVSGVPVVDAAFRPLGVVTQTDLLHAGAVAAVSGGSDTPHVVPDRRVSDVIASHGAPARVAAGESLANAAKRMRDLHVHRILVVEDDELVGLLSTWDLMRVVASTGLAHPVDELMSSPVLQVPPTALTSAALEKLSDSHVHGLVVSEQGWPIGVFTQEEALAAERWPEATTVEQWLNPCVLVVPGLMAVHRAATQAIAMRARHLVVMGPEGIRGIVTGTDLLALAIPRDSE